MLSRRKSWKSRKSQKIFCISSQKRKQGKRLCCEFVYFIGGIVNHEYFSRAPSDIILKPLSLDNAEIVDDEWPSKHHGSRFLVNRLIEFNPNIGAFNKDNELMGWCLRLQSGPLGALQVRQQFMRKGIGTLLTIAMCKILANMDMDTFALVDPPNIASQIVFAKLGFKKTDETYWLRTSPIDGAFKWNDSP